MAVTTATVTATQTGHVHKNGSGASINALYDVVGHHYNQAFGAFAGHIFPIPDIPVADITEVKLFFKARQAGAFRMVFRVEQGDAENFTTSGADRVDTRWTDIGSTLEFQWDATHTAGVFDEIANVNLTSRVKSAITAAGGTGNIAVIGDSAPTTNAAHQMFFANATLEADRPYLEFSYDVTPVPDSVRVTAPEATASVGGVVGVAPVEAHDNQIYQIGTALAFKDNPAEGSRRLDVWEPPGTPPAGGWPVVIGMHGGFWTSGTYLSLPDLLTWHLLDRGFAVALATYRLNATILDNFEWLASGQEISFPAQVHDLKVCIAWLKDQGYNTDHLYMYGHSAGGHQVQLAAYSKGDTTVYNGKYPGSWGSSGNVWPRPAHVNRSNTSSYPFDFNQNGDAANLDDFTVRGIFLVASPTDLKAGVMSETTPDGVARSTISNGRRASVSRDVITTIDLSEYGELDVNKYINPDAGPATEENPYAGKADVVPDFPIAYFHGLDDILVTKAAGYTPLEDALIATGYINSAPTPNVISDSKLTLFEAEGIDHGEAETAGVMVANFLDWVDAVEALAPTGPAAYWYDGATETYIDLFDWDGATETPLNAASFVTEPYVPPVAAAVDFLVLDEGSDETVSGSSGTVTTNPITYDAGDILVVATAWARSSSGGIPLGVSGLGFTWEREFGWTDGSYGFRRTMRIFVAEGGAGGTGTLDIGATSAADIQDMVYKVIRVRGSSGLTEIVETRHTTPKVSDSTTFSAVPADDDGVLSLLFLESGAGVATIPSDLTRLGSVQSSSNTRVFDSAAAAQDGSTLGSSTTWTWTPSCYFAIASLVFATE